MKLPIALCRLCLLSMWVGLLCFTPLVAQEVEEIPEAAEELSRAEQKQQAKQARIDEYLRKKEARRVEKEAKRTAQDAARAEAEAEQTIAASTDDRDERERQLREAEAEKLEEMQLAEEKAQADEAKRLAAAARVNRSKPSKKTRSVLPRDLARAQANVRATDLGDNETVKQYLDLIDLQQASPEQLGALGSFLAQNGLHNEALEYYKVALRLESDNALLWVNHGTLLLKNGEMSAATNSFQRALMADPNNAVAHYNMGAALDELGRYDEAISAYTAALTLDPDLGDPSHNPQAANNDRLLAVRLMLFQQQTGRLSVPMIDLETGKLVGAVNDDDSNP